MECKIDGCDNEVSTYHSHGVCNKHYMRYWRYGTYELTRVGKKKYRLTNPDGYQKIHVGTHYLPTSNGYIYEHRKVVFDMYGVNLPNCELCGKETNWETCVIDHKDDDVSNNSPSNLRPVCDWCNTSRGIRKQVHEYYPATSLTVDGKTMTANEWSRQPGIMVSNTTIIARKRAGYSDYDAVYGPKKTHNYSMTKDAQRKREKAKLKQKLKELDK